MRIVCDGCGAIVSSEVPDSTVLDAFVECPQCIEERVEDVDPCPARWTTQSGVVDHCRRLGPHWSHKGSIAEWMPA